jgi:uncharacterized membrane protein YdbT with pleckstrin-like domain
MQREQITETGVYDGKNVRITDGSIETNGQSIPLSDVAAVTVAHRWINPTVGYVALAVGVALALIGYLVWGTLLTPVIAGLILAVAGIVLINLARTGDVVRLTTSDGSRTEVPVGNRAEARRVAEMIVTKTRGRRWQ